MRFAAPALIVILAVPAAGYVRTTTSASPSCPDGVARPLFWAAIEIPWIIDDAGSADVAPSAATDAARASFATWDEVPCSYIAFRFDGAVRDAPIGYVFGGPNVNTVKWLEQGWMQSARSIAVTLTTFDCNTGAIYDADIVLNGESFQFTTTPVDTSAADIQNTITHEVGHVLGFDHNPDPESTMYADAPLGEIRKRDLTADDQAGLCAVYPVGMEPNLDAGIAPDATPAPDAGSPSGDGNGGCGCGAAGPVRAGRDASALIFLLAVLVVRRRGLRLL